MALGTSALRGAWSPACRNGHHLLPMYVALDACFKRWSYGPRDGTGAANCRPITGGSGYSLHSYFGEAPFTFWNGYRIPLMALAVDVNPDQNPYGPRLVTDMPRGMIDDITAIRTKSGDQMIGWGGYFTGNRDAMHFQGVCTPSAMATGIDPKTLPLLPLAPAPPEDDMYGPEDRELAHREAERATKRNADVQAKLSHIIDLLGDDNTSGTVMRRLNVLVADVRKLLAP